MKPSLILDKIKSSKIGKLPLVILPLDEYERMKEDLEMLWSRKLPQDIIKARQEIKEGNKSSLIEVKRKLGL